MNEPFTPAEFRDLAIHLEDEAAHGIGNKAAARLLASVEHAERLLLALVNVDPMTPDEYGWRCNLCVSSSGYVIGFKVDHKHRAACPWFTAHAYLAARGLIAP